MLELIKKWFELKFHVHDWETEEIKAAQAEKEALENIRKKNEGVLAKLNAILE